MTACTGWLGHTMWFIQLYVLQSPVEASDLIQLMQGNYSWLRISPAFSSTLKVLVRFVPTAQLALSENTSHTITKVAGLQYLVMATLSSMLLRIWSAR